MDRCYLNLIEIPSLIIFIFNIHVFHLFIFQPRRHQGHQSGVSHQRMKVRLISELGDDCPSSGSGGEDVVLACCHCISLGLLRQALLSLAFYHFTLASSARPFFIM